MGSISGAGQGEIRLRDGGKEKVAKTPKWVRRGLIWGKAGRRNVIKNDDANVKAARRRWCVTISLEKTASKRGLAARPGSS